MPIREICPKDISISDLPLDLLCLPLMLILLSWLSVLGAVIVVSCLVVSLLGLYLYKGKLRKVGVSLLIYLLQLGAYYLLEQLSTLYFPAIQGLCLWREMLFMLSFLVLHLLLFRLIRYRKFPYLPRTACSCERRRYEALCAEYLRFERVLFFFCVLAIGLCLVCSLIFPNNWLMEISISHSLSLVAGGILCFEILHLAWLRKRLLAEQWIPVLDEQDRAMGRVARSEVARHAGTVPTVRLLVVSCGMLYLERTTPTGTKPLYDTPFEDWLSEVERPEEVAQRMIDARFCGIRRAVPRQLLPYRMSVAGQARLVYLMTVELEDPGLLYIPCKPSEGKWWSLTELQALMCSGVCSVSLLSEWETLEQTLFLAQRLRQS